MEMLVINFFLALLNQIGIYLILNLITFMFFKKHDLFNVSYNKIPALILYINKNLNYYNLEEHNHMFSLANGHNDLHLIKQYNSNSLKSNCKMMLKNIKQGYNLIHLCDNPILGLNNNEFHQLNNIYIYIKLKLVLKQTIFNCLYK